MTIFKNSKGLIKTIFRVLLFVIVAIVTIGGQCVGKVKPNPKRKLVLSKEGYYLFNPVWHPNGEWIYYLGMPVPEPPETWPMPAFFGSIWRVKTDGTNEQLILDGHFACLSLSPDGEKLVFIKGSYPDPYPIGRDNKIILADTSGMIIDTIQISGGESIWWMKIGRDNKIYYSTTIASDTGGYFRINLDSTGEELLFTSTITYYFDPFPDGSLFLHTTPPSLNPLNTSYVTFPDDRRKDDLVLKNLTTGEIDSLIAAPYGTPVYIDLPSWSPDGDKVIYCVGPARGSSTQFVRKLELWMVEGIELR